MSARRRNRRRGWADVSSVRLVIDGSAAKKSRVTERKGGRSSSPRNPHQIRPKVGDLADRSESGRLPSMPYSRVKSPRHTQLSAARPPSSEEREAT